MAEPSDYKLIAEEQRLKENYSGEKKWLEWGPYLSERQWGTVREDYSEDAEPWNYFTHEHARSRVYRWGEDGIAGISDRHCAVCFSICLWNGNDRILKERLYGLAGPEGNHGEDCKELYYYLDSTPTHSYMKHLYKYPQNAYPYEDLLYTNQKRGRDELEYELLDTGVLDDNNYFDVFTEYAKAEEEDILVRITICNRGEKEAPITVMPTLWLRNLWHFGITENNGQYLIKREDDQDGFGVVRLTHPRLGEYFLSFEMPDQWMFTNNETNEELLFGKENSSPYVKDLFHHAVIENDFTLTQATDQGTKFSPTFKRSLKGGFRGRVALAIFKATFHGKSTAREFQFRICKSDSGSRYFLQAVPQWRLQRFGEHSATGVCWHDVVKAVLQFRHGILDQW